MDKGDDFLILFLDDDRNDSAYRDWSDPDDCTGGRSGAGGGGGGAGGGCIRGWDFEDGVWRIFESYLSFSDGFLKLTFSSLLWLLLL